MPYVEYLIEIIDSMEKVIRNVRILMVKVLWQHNTLDEVTCELEDEMQNKYPELF